MPHRDTLRMKVGWMEENPYKSAKCEKIYAKA
jgi:hypothetical protein